MASCSPDWQAPDLGISHQHARLVPAVWLIRRSLAGHLCE
jgi:hypothetical protein